MKPEKIKMKNISIGLPNIYADNLEKLEDKGSIPSRSEGVRLAIRQFLEQESHFADLLDLEPKKK
jgi:metal-responsive CopG/Arc/MetJ family transcriptional regulator